MKTESLRLLEQYLADQLSPGEARSAEQVLARGDAEAGRGEALAVYAFLSEMGPSQPPPGLVARTCERLSVEAAHERSGDTGRSRMRSIGAALSWSYRGPTQVITGSWNGNATRFSVQGLGMSRFALGPLGLRPLGLSRATRPKPRAPNLLRRVIGLGGSP